MEQGSRKVSAALLATQDKKDSVLRIVEANAASAVQNKAAATQQTAPTAPSPLFSRLSTFLPKLKAANERLEGAAAGPSDGGLNIEVVPQAQAPALSDSSDSDSDSSEEDADVPAHPSRPHIEMDIACGVLDLQDAAACKAAEAAAADAQSLDDAVAKDTICLAQDGLKLPGGAVISPPAGSCGAKSCSEGREAGLQMSVLSTRRCDGAACPDKLASDNPCELSPSKSAASDACLPNKKQKILML